MGKPINQLRDPRRQIQQLSMADLDSIHSPSVNSIASVAPSKTSMKDFERLRERKITLQLDKSRNELEKQRRYVEQLLQALASQRILSMQQLHPASPLIQDDDDNYEQQDVQSIHHSGPLTRTDLSITGSNPM